MLTFKISWVCQKYRCAERTRARDKRLFSGGSEKAGTILGWSIRCTNYNYSYCTGYSRITVVFLI